MNPKLLNFIPLLVWSIGVLAVMQSACSHDILKYFGMRKASLFYRGGIVFWLLVACYLNS